MPCLLGLLAITYLKRQTTNYKLQTQPLIYLHTFPKREIVVLKTIIQECDVFHMNALS